MTKEWAPYVAVIALIVSIGNLAWSVYKELVLRARVKVKFGLQELHHADFKQPIPRLILTVVNHGPGSVHLEMIQLRDTNLVRRCLRRAKEATIIHDYESPFGGILPTVLAVGEKRHFSFDPYTVDLAGPRYTQIGIADSFGRVHWCKTREMREANKRRSNLPPKPLRSDA